MSVTSRTVAGVVLLMLASSAGAQKSSVVFDAFDSEDPDSAWSVTYLGQSPADDLDGPGGVPCWSNWCYRVTALATTTPSPGEWTHMSVGIPSEQPYTSVEALIEASMVVSVDDGDYTRKLRSSGGPLPMRGAEWNNGGDNLVDEGESADFCFTAPAATVVSVPIGMKVGSVRLFDTIAGPGAASCGSTMAPLLDFRLLFLLAVLLLSLGIVSFRRRGKFS